MHSRPVEQAADSQRGARETIIAGHNFIGYAPRSRRRRRRQRREGGNVGRVSPHHPTIGDLGERRKLPQRVRGGVRSKMDYMHISGQKAIWNALFSIFERQWYP